jgi:hypothetical protein
MKGKYPTLGELKDKFPDCQKVKSYLKPNGEFPNGDGNGMNKDVEFCLCRELGCEYKCPINSGLKNNK